MQHNCFSLNKWMLSYATCGKTSSICTEMAKRKLKTIKNCWILNGLYFIFYFCMEQDSNHWNQALIAWRACYLFTGCDVTLLLSPNWKSFSSPWHWIPFNNHWSSNVKGYLSSLGFSWKRFVLFVPGEKIGSCLKENPRWEPNRSKKQPRMELH